MRGHSHGLATLPLEIEPMEPTAQEVGWVRSAHHGKDKSHDLAKNKPQLSSS